MIKLTNILTEMLNTFEVQAVILSDTKRAVTSNVFNNSVSILVNLIIILYIFDMEPYRKFLGLIGLLDFVFQVV